MPKSKISWTDEALNFLTWNCSKVSPGCKHCYAEAHSRKYPQNSAGGGFLDYPQFRAKALEELRLTKSGTVVFINTHSDTFHQSIPLTDIKRMFTHMNQRSDLIFLVLTKRPHLALEYAPYLAWTDNIWLGVSIETMDYYGRLEMLAQIPAKHKFVSFEPLLGPIQAECLLAEAVEWVIVGGESGEGKRPLDKAWAAHLQRFCAAEHIPFYFKQGSSLYPDQDRLLNEQEYNERPAAFAALRAQYQVEVDQGRLF